MLAAVACAGLGVACSSGAIDDDSTSRFTLTTTLTSNGDGDGDGDGNDSRETGTGHDTQSPETTGPAESCDDNLLNQDETDVDCGGMLCSPCAEGLDCLSDSDCATASCIAGTCVEPSCSDAAANGNETDVDCGGPDCPACADNLGCVEAGDCDSGVCTGGVCVPPGCGDNVLNGSETDIDCGGPSCSGCNEGEVCIGDSDCLSQYCSAGQCAPADCLTDADCDNFDGQCTMGTCSPQHTCQATPINQGQGCDDGDLCSMGETCSNGTCGGAAPVDCSNLSNTCNVGMCNPNNGQCVAQPANQNGPCDDGNACTVASVCNNGSCADPNAPGYIFYDDFSDNSAGWTLGTEWQIGAATASNCADACPGNDPGTDHTSTNDNGIAGVVLGGCATTTIHADYCLTSPYINATALPGDVWLTFWRHLHSDYPSYMTSKVEVYNGNTWQLVWTNACCSCDNDGGWTEQAFNVSAYKNANFRVRFCHAVGQGGAFISGSWSVDDVTIAAAQCTP